MSGFWNRVKNDLETVVQEGTVLLRKGSVTLAVGARQMAKEGAATMTAETRRVLLASKLHYQIYRLNQQAKAKFAEIGGLVYDQSLDRSRRAGIPISGKLSKLLKETKGIEKRIARLKGRMPKSSLRFNKKKAA